MVYRPRKISQRRIAERMQNLWNNYISVPVIIEQFMVWLDDFQPNQITWAIKLTARKRAELQGALDSEAALSYANKMLHEQCIFKENKLDNKSGV